MAENREQEKEQAGPAADGVRVLAGHPDEE